MIMEQERRARERARAMRRLVVDGLEVLFFDGQRLLNAQDEPMLLPERCWKAVAYPDDGERVFGLGPRHDVALADLMRKLGRG